MLLDPEYQPTSAEIPRVVRLQDGRRLLLDHNREVVWEGARWWAPYNGHVVRYLKPIVPRSCRWVVAHYPQSGRYGRRYYHLLRSPVRGTSLRELWGEAERALARQGGNSEWEWRVAPILQAWFKDPAWRKERAARAVLEALAQ